MGNNNKKQKAPDMNQIIFNMKMMSKRFEREAKKA